MWMPFWAWVGVELVGVGTVWVFEEVVRMGLGGLFGGWVSGTGSIMVRSYIGGENVQSHDRSLKIIENAVVKTICEGKVSQRYM